MNGKIICIEGNDRVGKHTQALLLTEYIRDYGYNVKTVSFPNYGTAQAQPVESYLAGSFPMLGPLEASMLYAFDRSVTFRELHLKSFLKDGGVLVLDRYTPSNIIYQVARSMKDSEELNVASTKAWNLAYKIEQLEYNVLELPRPDAVVYLSLNRSINKKLMETAEEIKGNNKKDFHESDEQLLDRVSEIGLQFAKKCSWHVVECYNHDTKEIYPKEVILTNILKTLSRDLNIPAK